MKKTLPISFLASVVSLAQTAPVTSTSKPFVIAGTVQGSDGSTIISGTISLTWVNPPTASRAKTVFAQTLSATGAFEFAGVYPGTYLLCPRTVGDIWLSPCQWGGKSPVVTVPPGGIVPTVNLVMHRAALVPIRVDDPTQVLAFNDGLTFGAQLMLNSANDSFQLVRLLPVSVDGSGRDYRLAIPYGRTVSLVVVAPFFRILNVSSQSTLLKTPSSIPIFVPAGASVSPIYLSVVGVNP
jgi:hypothetical protein